MSISHWMSWEAGVDLVAVTAPGLQMPNIIVHVARMVHTPVGSAPAGMVLIQTDPSAAPQLFGFISPNLAVGQYFGPRIFAGTPFENAPVLTAAIDISTPTPSQAIARIQAAGLTIETHLTGLGALQIVHRAPAAMPPFAQQGLEAAAAAAKLLINGKDVSIIVPPIGITGGPAAVWAPAGLYAR